MHGSFARDNTFNTMVAFGPDFKNIFVDRFPSEILISRLLWRTSSA